ncbi:aminopeptidase P family protein [Maritimibacter sp. 55A14]|uniref:M24 family metallopeptidase n=1 Tax=Maritimibacter sp. 55A14 TaxID=2174844 RepID=UPI000D61E056|nr:Xaa-Pro peptidase family protein [Maritimibacter sp. 55A14]PWE31382.1 aminopeptidase P family protein [Maritimibacter sp. 55A14]
MHKNPFSDAELARRLDATRRQMETRQLDIAVFSAPESVFYLTGLDHWGYFAPHHLVVPLAGEPVLITREMERVSIENQVRNAAFRGHSDSESAADCLAGLLARMPGVRIGIEAQSTGLSDAAGRALRAAMDGRAFEDISDLSPHMRLVKSDEEMALMRRAAVASDAAAMAAVAAIRDGAREADVAAEAVAAMTRAGGNPPGFGPFIRPDARLGEEHTTWGEGRYAKGERVFMELAGCVSRYHAPLGRLVHIGSIRDEDARMAETCKIAFDAVRAALRPGARARDVYAAWQDVADAAGMAHYRRHHCGYLVGIGLPPSWTGGNSVTGLRHDSDLEIVTGMSFHILSWLMGTGKGDFFMSNCVLLGPDGAEVLTRTPSGPQLV